MKLFTEKNIDFLAKKGDEFIKFDKKTLATIAIEAVDGLVIKILLGVANNYSEELPDWFKDEVQDALDFAEKGEYNEAIVVLFDIANEAIEKLEIADAKKELLIGVVKIATAIIVNLFDNN